jgi:Mn2+/Fe2+ NRAMP family transporter
MNNSGKIA